MMKKIQTKTRFGEVVASACYGVLLLLVSVAFLGCGKSEKKSRSVSRDDSEEDAKAVSTSESEDGASAPADTLVVKGLYVGMPGDDAVKACKKVVAASDDLVVVDFRKGIEHEKDAATKAKEEAVYQEKVKQAEADVAKFLEWNNVDRWERPYDPTAEGCCGKEDRGRVLSLDPESGAKLANSDIGIVGAMAALARIHGYQVEWMLPAKRKDYKGKDTEKLNLSIVGKLELPEKEEIYKYCQGLLETGVRTRLYGKRLQIPKEHDDRIFVRLVLQDAKGNPVKKEKLAGELVLGYPQFFKDIQSRPKQELLNAAEKELEPFLKWTEMRGGGEVEYINVPDPSEIRMEETQAREFIAAREKMEANRQKKTEEINVMQKQMEELEKKANDLANTLNQLAIRGKKATRQQFQALKRRYDEKMKEREGVLAKINEIKEKIKKAEDSLATNDAAAVTESRFLKEALNRERGAARRFETAMELMARNCKVMVEWGVLTEPADKIEEIIKPITIQEDLDLNPFKEGDMVRKRLFFEKDMVDLESPVWFRLVLKTTNGVAVAKKEIVRRWLADRGHVPPRPTLTIDKKNLIEIAFKKEGELEDQLKGLCFVWIDDQGKVKEIYFNEDGLARIFNAGDQSCEEFAKLLSKSYPRSPRLKPKATARALDEEGNIRVLTETFSHRDPKGYEVEYVERSLLDKEGRKLNPRMIEGTRLGLRLNEDSLFLKYFKISAIRPTSAQQFD